LEGELFHFIGLTIRVAQEPEILQAFAEHMARETLRHVGGVCEVAQEALLFVDVPCGGATVGGWLDLSGTDENVVVANVVPGGKVDNDVPYLRWEDYSSLLARDQGWRLADEGVDLVEGQQRLV
jgi:hypothetical protein